MLVSYLSVKFFRAKAILWKQYMIRKDPIYRVSHPHTHAGHSTDRTSCMLLEVASSLLNSCYRIHCACRDHFCDLCSGLPFLSANAIQVWQAPKLCGIIQRMKTQLLWKWYTDTSWICSWFGHALLTSFADSTIVTSAQKFEMEREMVFPWNPSDGFPIKPILYCQKHWHLSKHSIWEVPVHVNSSLYRS